MELFRGYVPTRNKQCLEKFKGVEKLKTRSDVPYLFVKSSVALNLS